MVLNELLDEFSKLDEKSQKLEIDSKLKEMLVMINTLNGNTELLLGSYTDDSKLQLTRTYSLICALENEIGKLLEKDL